MGRGAGGRAGWLRLQVAHPRVHPREMSSRKVQVARRGRRGASMTVTTSVVTRVLVSDLVTAAPFAVYFCGPLFFSDKAE